jgi:hypothetical protein
MKFIITLIIISMLSFAACLYFPWWSVAIVSFLIILFIPQRPGTAFLCGFFALFILWAGLSFWISNNNDHVLAHKISLLVLSVDNPFLLILITGLIGGITGGLGSLAGGLSRSIFLPETRL